jgi:hypothetical protein
MTIYDDVTTELFEGFRINCSCGQIGLIKFHDVKSLFMEFIYDAV